MKINQAPGSELMAAISAQIDALAAFGMRF